MTGLVLAILRPVQAVLDVVLRLGRWIGIACIGLMVVAILLQVVMRYVFNNALPWPEEAARFLMLWLTGLMAPTAYRHGGFVAIETLTALLPRVAAGLLGLALLLMSAMVLMVGLDLGARHVKSGWLFASSSLYVPMEIVGQKGFKLKLAWMYMSLYVGLWLLLAVNVELILRQLVTLMGGEGDLRPQIHADLTAE